MSWWPWYAIDSSNTVPTHLPFGSRRARSTGRTHVAPGTRRAPYCDVAISRIAAKAACVLLSWTFLLRRKMIASVVSLSCPKRLWKWVIMSGRHIIITKFLDSTLNILWWPRSPYRRSRQAHKTVAYSRCHVASQFSDKELTPTVYLISALLASIAWCIVNRAVPLLISGEMNTDILEAYFRSVPF
jgi:hypothetical protein